MLYGQAGYYIDPRRWTRATEAVLYYDQALPRRGQPIRRVDGERSHQAEGMPANDDEQLGASR